MCFPSQGDIRRREDHQDGRKTESSATTSECTPSRKTYSSNNRRKSKIFSRFLERLYCYLVQEAKSDVQAEAGFPKLFCEKETVASRDGLGKMSDKKKKTCTSLLARASRDRTRSNPGNSFDKTNRVYY